MNKPIISTLFSIFVQIIIVTGSEHSELYLDPYLYQNRMVSGAGELSMRLIFSCGFSKNRGQSPGDNLSLFQAASAGLGNTVWDWEAMAGSGPVGLKSHIENEMSPTF